jgi:hypothetical protein
MTNFKIYFIIITFNKKKCAKMKGKEKTQLKIKTKIDIIDKNENN